MNATFLRRYVFVLAVSMLFGLHCEKIWGQSKTVENTGDVLLFALPASALTCSLIVGRYL